MKTKIIALFAILALAFVGLNTTSCSKDDNDNDSTSDSASLGKTDGTAFANAYATYKAKGNGCASVDTMLKYGKKYRNSNDKAYKAGFIAAATRVTVLTESQLIALLESESESDIIACMKTMPVSSAKVGSDI
jgi:hypothetical protein